MFKNIQLEISLKPFRRTDDAYIEQVCRELFDQWKPLVRHTPTVSVMMWTADGSEILDYRGNMSDTFEWCRYVGGANNREKSHTDTDPAGIGLHTRSYLYMQDPPEMTYAILRKIVAAFKRVGHEVLGADRAIQVGETFDVGPEFARSPFKYERHNEICLGSDMGKGSMVCSYATLHADNVHYAGFPDGIPEGMPFGTFFGRQSQIFLSDMGYDFIWFSNGLGFGRDVWSTTGATFDGTQFFPDQLEPVKQISLDFWRLFKKECSFPVQTRGTNMSTGIDFSTDAVPLAAIYKENPDILPPPNSPWAALDADYGLELMGYMSRIAEIPRDRYLFRYYIHDPWWANSPWYDRYGGQPHDIYLPMACARIGTDGKVQQPTDLSLLSVDNSFGELPEACANEPIPHLLKSEKDAPDAPSPFVWVYPFREYNEAITGAELNDMFTEDWFIRGAINNGFPLSTVTSTDSFLKQDPSIYAGCVLVTPVPYAGTAFEKAILAYAANGGRVLFYGKPDRASAEFRDRIHVKLTDTSISGELPITVNGKPAGTLLHDPLVCSGGINTVFQPAPDAKVLAEAGSKVIATVDSNVVWLRAVVSATYTGGSRLIPHDTSKYFIGETLMPESAGIFGWELHYQREDPCCKLPVLMICRSDNAFMYNVFMADTTVQTSLHTPLGAPVLPGGETLLRKGKAIYHFAKSEHREGRVFVEQDSGVVRAVEMTPGSYQMRRRIQVSGLKDATVRFFAEDYCKNEVVAVVNTKGSENVITDPLDGGIVTNEYGTFYELHHVTGNVIFSMPRRGIFAQ